MQNAYTIPSEFQMDVPFLRPFCSSCSVLLFDVNCYLIISPEKTSLKEVNEAKTAF